MSSESVLDDRMVRSKIAGHAIETPMAAKRQSLVDLARGSTRPAVSKPPLLSSADSPWNGIFIEHNVASPTEMLDMAPLHHDIVVHLSKPVNLEWKIGAEDEFRTVLHSPGNVSLIPAMTRFSVRIPEPSEFLSVSLEPKFVTWAAHELITSPNLELTPQLAINDGLLETLALRLKREIEAGNPGGRCFGETLGMAMAVQIVREYSATPAPDRAAALGGLAAYQLRRVIDFIHAQFSTDISLGDLANVAQLSPFHFARMFKLSTGMSPHQYLRQFRVERARDMLLKSRASITEVALAVGFCDQSHLGANFKKVFGMTPNEFRRNANRK